MATAGSVTEAHAPLTVKPIAVTTSRRGIDLQVKVTFPSSGENLPVIVFSHGKAWSYDAYEPLVDLRPVLEDWVLEPTTMPWGNRSALVRDPDGNLAA
jgi:hypothetical protein